MRAAIGFIFYISIDDSSNKMRKDSALEQINIPLLLQNY